MGDGVPLYANMTEPDAFGWFTLNVIPSDVGGGVGAFDYEGYTAEDNSTEDPLVSGMTYWLNITLVPEVSTDDAIINGTVYDSSTGLPLEDVIVQFSSSNEWTDGPDYSNFTFTNALGYYEMNVTNGSADVWFSASGYSMNMFEEIQVDPLDVIVLDAWLTPLTATVMGNVTDGSSGLGIGMARVVAFDGMGNMSMAITNSTGAYVLEVFDGTALAMAAEADGYSRSWMVLDIAPGATLWQDFEIWPVDAWMNGTVIDEFSHAPIADAGLNMWSPVYEDWTNSDAVGEYNFTELVAGDYTLEVWAGGYRDYSESVTVMPGGNTWVVEMTPWDIPDTCMLYGWVNQTDSGGPIGQALVEVGIGPEDQSENHQVMTDGTGFYQMMIPAMELIWVVNASDHVHASGVLNASGLTELELSAELALDQWAPNMTYSDQFPLENISTHNPTFTDIAFDEDDLRQMLLFHFNYWYNDGTWDYYYNVQMLYTSFQPLSEPSNTLPYMVDGVHYTVQYGWDAQVSGGWLWNASDELYLPAYEFMQGPDTYDALRGYYMNESVGWEVGTLIFDRATGVPIMFRFDYGLTADLLDPTAMFAPEGQVLQKDPGNMWPNSVITQHIGEWSLIGLQFQRETVVPSGQYYMLFVVFDWADHLMVDMRMLMVDTDPPSAEAPPDMGVETMASTMLDGTASSDNVGIVTYMWEYVDDLGQTVVLYGDTVNVTFAASGSYDVTLTVWDAAGNQATDVVTVTASDSTPPVADAGPDQFVMAGEFVYFNASGSSDNVGIVNWTWTFTHDGVPYTLWGETVAFIFSDIGGETIVVTLTVTDGDGNSDTDTLTVEVSGWIPEFPTLLIPVMLIAAMVALVSRKRR
jgi:hypothetical protein